MTTPTFPSNLAGHYECERIVYPNVLKPEKLERIKKMAFDTQDTIIASYPKTGMCLIFLCQPFSIVKADSIKKFCILSENVIILHFV